MGLSCEPRAGAGTVCLANHGIAVGHTKIAIGSRSTKIAEGLDSGQEIADAFDSKNNSGRMKKNRVNLVCETIDKYFEHIYMYKQDENGLRLAAVRLATVRLPFRT